MCQGDLHGGDKTKAKAKIEKTPASARRVSTRLNLSPCDDARTGVKSGISKIQSQLPITGSNRRTKGMRRATYKNASVVRIGELFLARFVVAQRGGRVDVPRATTPNVCSLYQDPGIVWWVIWKRRRCTPRANRWRITQTPGSHRRARRHGLTMTMTVIHSKH